MILPLFITVSQYNIGLTTWVTLWQLTVTIFQLPPSGYCWHYCYTALHNRVLSADRVWLRGGPITSRHRSPPLRPSAATLYKRLQIRASLTSAQLFDGASVGRKEVRYDEGRKAIRPHFRTWQFLSVFSIFLKIAKGNFNFCPTSRRYHLFFLVRSAESFMKNWWSLMSCGLPLLLLLFSFFLAFMTIIGSLSLSPVRSCATALQSPKIVFHSISSSF